MAKEIKFTEEELGNINTRQSIGSSFVQKLTQLHLEKKEEFKRLKQILEIEGEYTNLIQSRTDLFTELNKKYGDGNFDPTTCFHSNRRKKKEEFDK